MSDREALFMYRREQALTTLSEAGKMHELGFSARTIINRAYYSMFYMVLALFLKKGMATTTSKHSGIISLFDKEFILTGIFDRNLSRLLHRMFDKRMEFDYKDYSEPSITDAREAVDGARSFIEAVDQIFDN